GAINNLTLNPRPESQIAEGVLEVANEFTTAKTERPVLVVLGLSGGQTGVDPRSVLDKVRQSGLTMSSVTLAGGTTDSSSAASLAAQSGRAPLLGGGAR